MAVVIDGIEVGSSIANVEHLCFSSRQELQHSTKESHSRGVIMNLNEWNARYRSREEIDSDPAPLLVQAASGLAPGEITRHFEGFDVLHTSEGEIAEIIARRL